MGAAPAVPSSEDPCCRVCRGRAVATFSKRGFQIARCGVCDVEFVADPRREVVNYDAGYFSQQTSEGYAAYLQDRDLVRENFERRARWLARLVPGGRLLDVGAAYGFFVSVASKAGFDAVGLEPAADCASFAGRELDVEVITGRIEDSRFEEGSFDVVTMFDVIEHLEDPRAAVRRSQELLRPGGLLVVETGDAKSLLARLCGRHWYFYDPPQHITFFSLESLSRMVAEAGFGPPEAVGHLGRRVSVRNFAFQFGRALGGGSLGRFSQSIANSRFGKARFSVPDRGNAFVAAFRRRELAPVDIA